jgi:hypothetical protein
MFLDDNQSFNSEAMFRKENTAFSWNLEVLRKWVPMDWPVWSISAFSWLTELGPNLLLSKNDSAAENTAVRGEDGEIGGATN